MSTNLRLLIDADIELEVVRQLQEISALNIEHALSLEHLKTDEEVMKYAKDQGRIVLTLDRDFKKTAFPICTHPGIIRFTCRNKHSSELVAAFKSFVQCGHRVDAKHAITSVAREWCEIETGDGSTKHLY